MAETEEPADHIAEFCRRYRNVSESELRECIAYGPAEVRLYLEACGVIDDYPRRVPAAVRGDNIEVSK